jgi:large subunit ribosomal protein L24
MEICIMHINKFGLKKDDKVKVIAGKDKGKIGKILKVMHEKNRVLVEKVNIVKKHRAAKAAKNKQPGPLSVEAPFHLSNVMLVCSKCLTPVRIRRKKLEDGKTTRVCVKCNEIIDS